MRKYIVYYYTEKNDECVDCEIEFEASRFIEAYMMFQIKVKVYKRIYKIEEKVN